MPIEHFSPVFSSVATLTFSALLCLPISAFGLALILLLSLPSFFSFYIFEPNLPI